MSALTATSIDELCHTLGLRTPIGVIADAIVDGPPRRDGIAFTDEQLTALGVLAQPEAIAVVTHWSAPQPFAAATPVVHVIATRGPWLAEHVIDGPAHLLRAADAENAAVLLLDRTGFVEIDHSTECDIADVTLGAFRRLTELVRIGDRRRAAAALVGDGVAPSRAVAIVDAVAVGRVEVAGLGSDGRRFVGCDLAVVGDATTGRFLVPATQHLEAVPNRAWRHPSVGKLAALGEVSSNLRVLVERVSTEALHDELALIFGDA